MLSPSESVSKSTDTPLDTPPAYDGAASDFCDLSFYVDRKFGAQSRVVLKHLNEPPRPWVATAAPAMEVARPSPASYTTSYGTRTSTPAAINMPDVLQQHYIEGHTPLYWAIVKRTIDVDAQGIRLACLHNGDQWLYQALRLCPEFQALSHKTQLLLGVQVPLDTVVVGTPARDDAPFAVEFEFAQSRNACRCAGSVPGIHRTDGRWVVRLGGTEDSPSTFVQAAYVLEEHIPDTLDRSVRLELGLKGEQHVALPDAIQYPQSPFLTADGPSAESSRCR
ncbi:hypothetical protein B0H14DRAFT_3884931 [Mycena olivaceomarginata]|nr:hypothetical protein B0H14DRAFT_3907767 [Mycena olivaceomarginata]KAJ7801848.1 hypothetical protein B0H14DRAFT_3884931 [Mycena olivaceomarginata]